MAKKKIKSSSAPKLNKMQAKAVALPASANALILAGAGSGKTLVLTHRYKRLCQVDNFPPESILSVTFTNKAANEMRRRIADVTGIRYSLPWIGTFHGIANRVLRQHHDSVNLRKNYTIIDRLEQLSVLRKLYKTRLNTVMEKEGLVKTADAICRFKEHVARADRVEEYIDSLDQHSFMLKRYIEIYHAYEEYCREESLVDFTELILSFYDLLNSNSPAIDYLRNGLRAVLVDEFQDTNDLQFKLVRELCKRGQSVFLVGDDDQLIYSWRGANPENLNKVQRSFKDVEVVRLEQNYRSTQEILGIANALIKHNKNRMEKTLWSKMNADNGIKLLTNADEHIESMRVCQAIKSWHGLGVPYSEIAILYRKSFLARVLEGALASTRIPYEVQGGSRFRDREEVRNAMAWLKVCLDPDDDYCVERAINVPSRGIGRATQDRIEKHAKENGISYFETTTAMCEDESIQSRTRQALKGFCDLVKELSQYRHLHPRELLEKIYKTTSMLEYYEAKTRKDIDLSRKENLLELLNAADEYVEGRASIDVEITDQLEMIATSGNGSGKPAKAAKSGNGSAKAAKSGNGSAKAAKSGNGSAKAAKSGNGSAKAVKTARVEGAKGTRAELNDYSAISLAFVANTTLDSVGPDQANERTHDAVQLMTIHAAKGLEFRCVVLCGLEEGILPHLASSHHEDLDNCEEERRLCYVAITRAREALMLSSARNRNVRGRYGISEPSRFIEEMFPPKEPEEFHQAFSG